MSNRNLYLIVAGIVLVSSWALMSSPDSVVVDREGNVEGGLNKIRAGLQGQRFWKNQLIVLEKELNFARNYPTQLENMTREFEAEVDPILDEFEEDMNKFYAENPELRPSAAEQEADRLEQRKIEIEAEEMKNQMRRVFAAQAVKLETIQLVIKSNIFD